MTSKEWREWFVRNPFGTDSGPLLDDFEAVEGKRDEWRLQAIQNAESAATQQARAERAEGSSKLYQRAMHDLMVDVTTLESTLSRLREGIRLARLLGPGDDCMPGCLFHSAPGNAHATYCKAIRDSALIDEPKEDTSKKGEPQFLTKEHRIERSLHGDPADVSDDADMWERKIDEPKENEGKIQALVAASNRVRKAIRELSLEELDDALSPFEEVKT
jgi:hypothetical protein